MEKIKEIVQKAFIMEKIPAMTDLTECRIKGIQMQYSLPRHSALCAFCHFTVTELGIDVEKVAEFLNIHVRVVNEALVLNGEILATENKKDRYMVKLGLINNGLIHAKIKK